MPEVRTVNVTFLFTDVEGSTRLVKQLRDGYAAVLADHRRLVRDAFARYGGEEVDTQGDAFFYVFARARDAAAAAAEAQRALQAHVWPEDGELRVRMGLHTGEPVVSEAGYHGMGVHRGARIMAAGHGGQILASQATAAMLADEELPGVEQRELGEFQLKDLDRSERVYQLDVEGLPTEFPPLRTGDAPTAYAGKEDELVAAAVGARQPFYRRPVVIGAIAGVLAAAVAIPVFALGGGGSGGNVALAGVQDNAVGVVDSQTRAIVDEAPEIASPQRVAAGEGAIWATSSSGGGSVVRLDPESHDVVDTIEVGSGPVGIAAGAGAVWVANSLEGTVSRIDATTNREVGERIKVGTTPTGVAFGAGAVWVTNADDGTVTKIDPVTGAALKTIDADAAARWIAIGDGAVWVTDPVGNELVRIDARSGTVTNRIPVGSGPTAVAYGDGDVWVTNSLDGTLSRVDARARGRDRHDPGRRGAERRRGRARRRLGDRRGRRHAHPRRSGLSGAHDDDARRPARGCDLRRRLPVDRGAGHRRRPPRRHPENPHPGERRPRPVDGSGAQLRAGVALRPPAVRRARRLQASRRRRGEHPRPRPRDFGPHAERRRHDVHVPVARRHRVLRRPGVEGVRRPLLVRAAVPGAARPGRTTTKASSAHPPASSSRADAICPRASSPTTVPERSRSDCASPIPSSSTSSRCRSRSSSRSARPRPGRGRYPARARTGSRSSA